MEVRKEKNIVLKNEDGKRSKRQNKTNAESNNRQRRGLKERR